MGKWKWSIGALVVIVVLILGWKSLSGGSAPAPQSTNPSAGTTQTQQSSQQSENKIVDPNAVKFEGQANLAKYEGIAQKNPSNLNDQINAAVSSYVNADYQKAVSYYQKAVVLAPKNGEVLTYLGNAYFRGLKQPKQAIKYYTEATQYDPSYAYSWWNLAMAYEAMGNKTMAKSVMATALKKVSPSNSLYATLQKYATQLNQ